MAGIIMNGSLSSQVAIKVLDSLVFRFIQQPEMQGFITKYYSKSLESYIDCFNPNKFLAKQTSINTKTPNITARN